MASRDVTARGRRRVGRRPTRSRRRRRRRRRPESHRCSRCVIRAFSGSTRTTSPRPTLAHTAPSPAARPNTGAPSRRVAVTRPDSGLIFRRRSSGPDTHTEPAAYTTVGMSPVFGPMPGSIVGVRADNVDGSSAASPTLFPPRSRSTKATQRSPPPSARLVGVPGAAFVSGRFPLGSMREIV